MRGKKNIFAALFLNQLQVVQNFTTTFIGILQLTDRKQTMSFITKQVVQFIQIYTRLWRSRIFEKIFLSLFIIIKSTVIDQTTMKDIRKIRGCHSMYMVKMILITIINT